jgi:hypothetical protein
MQETLVAARRPITSLVTRSGVAWAVIGAAAFIVTAVTMLAAREVSSAGLGAAAQSWTGDLGFGLLVTGLPAAIISIVLLAQASFAHVVLARRMEPAQAPVVAVIVTYGVVAVIGAVAAFPVWFPISVAIAGLVVATGVQRTFEPVR